MKPGKRLGKGGAFIYAAVERRNVQTRAGRVREVSGSVQAALADRCDAETGLSFAEKTTVRGSLLVTDGGSEFARLTEGGFDHDSHNQTRSPSASNLHLRRIHLFFSNFKTWLRGTFHGVSLKHLGRYLDEQVYRFNRRSHGADTFGFLVRRVVRATWTSKRTLAAEGSA